jgi:hypothetical protein
MGTMPMTASRPASSFGQDQGQSSTDSGQPQTKAVLDEFRGLAETIQGLAKKYPEFVDAATQILPLIQKGMVRVAGNPERTPERQAPPVGP